MKKLFALLILTAPALFAQTNLPAAAVADPTNTLQTTAIDGYAARVNDTIITYGEIRENTAPFVKQLASRFKGRELAERIQAAYLDGREALIEEALLKAEVKTRGLNLPEKAVNDEINRLIRERFDNNRALLTKALAARRMTFEEWKEEVREQITIRVFYSQEVTRRASVSAEAVRVEYERTKEQYRIPFKVRYRFILINKGSTAEDLAVKRKQADETLEKLRAGGDFDTIAQNVSEGDSSLSPWRSPDDVRAELRPALLKTPAGQVSSLIESPGEFYIVKVEERREEGFVPFEDVQQQIEKQLLAAEKDRLHQALISSITPKHFVERY